VVFATGASPGASVLRANLVQTRQYALEAGLIGADDLTTVLRLLDDPEFIFAMPLLVSAWGRRHSQPGHPPRDKPAALARRA
jgi:hypothetical protein